MTNILSYTIRKDENQIISFVCLKMRFSSETGSKEGIFREFPSVVVKI